MDVTNAAATAAYDLFQLKWSDLVIKMLQLPRHVFPRVLPTAHEYGATEDHLFGHSIPICCLARGT
jgi:glycerol kinase